MVSITHHHVKGDTFEVIVGHEPNHVIVVAEFLSWWMLVKHTVTFLFTIYCLKIPFRTVSSFLSPLNLAVSLVVKWYMGSHRGMAVKVFCFHTSVKVFATNFCRVFFLVFPGFKVGVSWFYKWGQSSVENL